MLENMRPGLLDEWLAFEAVEPSGQSWLQSAIIAREIATLGVLVQAKMGVKDIKWPKLDDFMPGTKPDKPDKAKANTDEEIQRRSAIEQAAFSKAFGS